MEIYLVGGAVRDQLLGLPIKERDFVVVGATPAEMLALGFKPVGKDFPVFLHPETHEEYALARTERKTSKGYHGFAFQASPEITLEEDLKRRDLTINAMAQTIEGKIIDPYGGQHDLQQRILHHVSPAFVEDPVRILRLARFAARFNDFHLHPETLQLMRNMVTAGEVNALVAERVWQEFERALGEGDPARFFLTLQECNAIAILFPELAASHDAVSNLQLAASQTEDKVIRFAALLHQLSVAAVQTLCERYRAPREYSELALLIARHYSRFVAANTANAEELLITLEMLDALRRPQRFEKFLTTCHLLTKENSLANSERLKIAYQTVADVTAASLLAQGLSGKAIAEGLRKLRLQALEKKLDVM